MKLLFYCILSYIFISTTRSSLFSNINVLSLVKDGDGGRYRERAVPRASIQKRSQTLENDADMNEKAHFQIDPVLNSFRRQNRQKQKPRFEIDLDTDEKPHFEVDFVPNTHKRHGRPKHRHTFDIDIGKDKEAQVLIDPVPNSLRRHGMKKQIHTFEIDTDEISDFEGESLPISFRKQGWQPNISRRRGSSDDFSSTSSSREVKDWQDEWKEKWMHKKFDAINSSYIPGDTVNMIGARPWGVACGDPNQHDMPWGSCMLPMECDPEYRIYRGDYLCGRTQYICCAMQITMYDLDEGFDLSFQDTGLDTDTKEKMLVGSKEDQKKHRQLMKKKRKRARTKRRKALERHIKKIQKEIRTIIKNQERNATKLKKRKTKQLKILYKLLKHQYGKDKRGIGDMHELEMIQMDEALKKKISQVREMNYDFIKNATFRDVIVNGTLNRQAARMLVEAYPELERYIHMNVKRRTRGNEAQNNNDLDHDVHMNEKPRSSDNEAQNNNDVDHDVHINEKRKSGDDKAQNNNDIDHNVHMNKKRSSGDDEAQNNNELDHDVHMNKNRRSGGGEAQNNNDLHYDVEYGMLYF